MLAGCGSQSATARNSKGAESAPTTPTASVAAKSEPAADAKSKDQGIVPSQHSAAAPVAVRPITNVRPIDKTFDDIKFDIQPDAPFRREMLTDEIESLAGQRIRIRGYILPTSQKRGIKQFVLVRDNQECCFGPGAALYDCVLVEMKPGHTAEYSVRPVAVEGTFKIELLTDPDEKPLAIYRLEGELVQH